MMTQSIKGSHERNRRQGFVSDEKDVHISYLPAAHVFEAINWSYLIYLGGTIGFYSGDILKLMDDIQVIKPTLFPTVPRLLNKIYGKIMDKINDATGVKGWLVRKAIDSKLYYLKE